MNRAPDARRVLVAVLGITACSTALRWLIPVNPSPLAVAFDEGLFERLAVSLTRHEWLGVFSTTTLAKGPAYSAFVAGAEAVRLPLQVAQQGVYLAGALAIAGCVWTVSRRPWLAVAVYAVLAFDPVNYNAMSATVTRENIYTGLALGFVGGVFLTVRAVLDSHRSIVPVLLAAPTGLFGGAFWLTREEGAWVLPSVALIGAGMVSARFLAGGVARERGMSGKSVVVGVVAAATLALTFGGPIALVHQRNSRAYGVAITSDLTSGEFPKAYATWSRIRGVALRQFVPINEAQRRAAYRVSPAAKELEPFLEDPANGWKRWGCPDHAHATADEVRLDICDDYPGGAAPWAFRDAAAAAGHFHDAPSFQRFFRRVDRELRAACDDERLRCARALPAPLQLSQRATFGAVARSAAYWFTQLTRHAAIYELYGPNEVNPMPAADRRFVRAALPETPRTTTEARAAARSYQAVRWPHLIIGVFYRLLVPLLFVMAMVKVALSIASRNRFRETALLTLAAALAGGVVTRLVIFGVVDTTQYFNHIRYQTVTRSFLIAGVLVVLAAPTHTPWIARLTRFRLRGSPASDSRSRAG